MACSIAGCGALPGGDEHRSSEPVAVAQQPLVHGWSKSVGGSSYDGYTKFTVDGSNNIIIIAFSEGSVDFGGGTLTTTSSANFLVKFDDDGNHLWSKMLENVLLAGVATDSAGNVNIVGTFYSSTDFGGGTLTCLGITDIFVVQYDASGNHVWSHRFGGPSLSHAAQGTAIAVDSDDNVIITGNYSGSLAFGSDSGTSVADDVFLAKLDSSGTPIFGKFFGVPSVPGAGASRAVTVDDDDNIMLTGWYYGSLDFGGGPTHEVRVPDTADGFLAKFDSAGDSLWSRTFGNTGDADGVDVTTDSLGNIALVGNFDGNMDIGGSTLTSAGSKDTFLAQFDGNGNHLWSYRFGGTNWEGPTSVSTNSAGDVFIAGYFVGAMNFGGGTLTSAGSADAFVAQFDDSGTHLWSANYGDANGQVGSIQIDSNGDAVLLGEFGGTVNLGGSSLTEAGNGDIFLAKLTP